ncbi:hypothetical protein [Bacillus sp. NPDC077027]|uniref:hypothetical protein n=1 Tax=Bacillus sp. NPDC077027 TaxID=3390548 RepID=UPI003D02B3DC
MILRGTFKVKEIKKKTQAKFFKDLSVGDEFQLQYSPSGSYGFAPIIFIHLNGARVHHNHPLQLRNNLENFVIEQIK